MAIDPQNTNVIELTGAVVKNLYEGEANTNAYTDAEKSKLAGIAAGAQVNRTAAEVATAYASEVPQVTPAERVAGTQTDLRTFSPLDIVEIVEEHAPASGGSGPTHTVLTSGNFSAGVLHSGPAPTASGNATDGYTVTAPSGCHVHLIDVQANGGSPGGTVQADGTQRIIYDNSANGYDRCFVLAVFDGANNTEFRDASVLPTEVISGNVTTLDVPNVGGNFGAVTLKLR